MMCNFSENYSFSIQNAVQGCYSTIHLFVVYYKNNRNELQLGNFVIISECLKHDATEIYLLIAKLIAKIKSKFGLVRKVFYFTDEIDFGFSAEWHFHATSLRMNAKSNGARYEQIVSGERLEKPQSSEDPEMDEHIMAIFATSESAHEQDE